MAYVDYKDVLAATNNGLDIIVMFYPDAAEALQRRDKKFKIRDEKTASAQLRIKNGQYMVTDFGDDQRERNAFGVCEKETGKNFFESVQWLASKFNVEGSDTWKEIKPNWTTRPRKENEQPKDYDIEFKDFTIEELAALGPIVTAEHCKDFNFKPVKSFDYVKKEEVSITESTEDYPIYAFDEDGWAKVYQPKSYDKRFRFRFLGKKPERFLYGLARLKKEYNRRKEKFEEQYDPDAGIKMEDPKLDYVFIVSGGSDGLNLRSFGHFPVWFNSESEKLNYDEYKLLKGYAKTIIYVPDLDVAGKKAALEISLRFLDIKIMMLPYYLTLKKDKRGNKCKDFKDFVVNFYTKREDSSFRGRLDKIIDNAMPAQFWTEYSGKNGKSYKFRPAQFYNFLNLNGFGRIKDEYTKDGFHFVRVDGNVVKKIHPVEVETFVLAFIRDRMTPLPLQDMIYAQQLSMQKLNKMDPLDVKFSSADKTCQYMFFENRVLHITAEDIILKNRGDIDKYIWEAKMHDHVISRTSDHFKIFRDKHQNLDIEINLKDNMFFNFLINTSRVHWRVELEDSLEKLPAKDIQAYREANKFNIAGPNLSDEEIYEQKLHLINKIYSIGYMLHTHKEPDKTWAVYAMDNKVAALTESHGGSGKSVFQKGIQKVLKKNHYIPGRDPKKTSDDFITHGITPDTDYILIDDCHEYLDFGFFYSWITGDMEVNNKNGMRFIIPFDDVPKMAFSSNYPLRLNDPSTLRRILYCVFSDYYHHKAQGSSEYRESRTVSDDFDGKTLYKDFDEHQWNLFYNFCAECIKFYLSSREKIEPPMDNVMMRNLLSEMGTNFKEWADVFFQKTDALGKLKYLDNHVIKLTAFDDLKAKTGSKFTPTSFKKRLVALCEYNNWQFNPSDIDGYQSDGRIMKKIDSETFEMFYIRTQPKTPEDFNVNDPENLSPTVKPVRAGDKLKNELPFD